MTVAFSSYYALISTVIFLRMRNEEKPSKKLSENCRGICPFCKAFLPAISNICDSVLGRGNEFHGDNIFIIKGSFVVDKSLVKNRIRSIRQLPIGKLIAADMNAFGGIGFIRYFRSAGYNLLMNSSIFVRLQVLLRSRKDIANFNWDYIAYEKCNQNRHRHFNSTN